MKIPFYIGPVLLVATFACGQSVNPLKITKVPNDQFALTWFGKQLRPYQIEMSSDLQSWMDIGPTQTGANQSLGLTVGYAPPAAHYRLRDGAIRPGFDSVMLDPDDDNASANPSLGSNFKVNFAGQLWSSCGAVAL